MKQLGTGVVILFIIISLGIIGAGYLIRNQPIPDATPLELRIAVTPMAHAWMSAMVARFNASDVRLIDNYAVTIVLNPVAVDDMAVWDKQAWNGQNHPDLWLASSTISAQYAQSEAKLPFTNLVPSVAESPLIWVAFADVAEAITQNGAQAFDWDTVQVAANAQTWANFGARNLRGNVNIAFALPDSTMNGLMVLYSAVSHFNQSGTLTVNAMTANLQTWFAPVIQSVPNFNTIGNDVASFMVRSGATVNIGMMPEALLLNQLEALTRRGAIRITYPDYAVVYDFPLVLWNSGDTPDVQRRASRAFADFLLADAQQAELPRYGLRAVSNPPSDADTLFLAGIPYGIAYTPQVTVRVDAVPFALTRALLNWFANQRLN